VNELNAVLAGSPASSTESQKNFKFAKEALALAMRQNKTFKPIKHRFRIPKFSPPKKLSPSKRINYIRKEVGKFGRLRKNVDNKELQHVHRLIRSNKPIRRGGIFKQVFIDHLNAVNRIRASKLVFRNRQKLGEPVNFPPPSRPSPRGWKVSKVKSPPRKPRRPVPKLTFSSRSRPALPRLSVGAKLYRRKPVGPRPHNLFNRNEPNDVRFYNYMKGKNIARLRPRNIIRELGNTPRIRRLIARAVEQYRWNMRLRSIKPSEIPESEVYKKQAVPYAQKVARINPEKSYRPKPVVKQRAEVEGGPSYAQKPEAWKLVQQALGSSANVRKMSNFMVEPVGRINATGAESGLAWINNSGKRHAIKETNIREIPGEPGQYRLPSGLRIRWRPRRVGRSKHISAVGVVANKGVRIYNSTKRFGKTKHRPNRPADAVDIYITNTGAFRTAIGTGGAPIPKTKIPDELLRIVTEWQKEKRGSVYEYIASKNYQVPN